MMSTRFHALVLPAVAAVTLLAAAPAARAADPMPGPAWRSTPLGKLISGSLGRMMVLRSELDLTDEQRTQVVSVLREHRVEIGQAARNVVRGRRALDTAVTAGATDEPAIRKAASQLGEAIGDAAVMRASIRAQLRPILTEQQVERIDRFRSDQQQAVDQYLEKLTSR